MHRLLTRALSAENPGESLPPGPGNNSWTGVEQQVIPDSLKALLDAMWAPVGFHLRADSTPTTIFRRPIPSAGATYGVQTHLVVGTSGLLGMAPGEYFYDRDRAALLRREARQCTASVNTRSARTHSLLDKGSYLVFAVLPGRSFGRYRHRAWPLWFADTAYAVAAVNFLCARRLPEVRGPSRQLRELLRLPFAQDTTWWLERDVLPEIPIAAVTLPDDSSPTWCLDPARVAALRHRRSPDLAEFGDCTAREVRLAADKPRVAMLAKASQQAWVLGATEVDIWTISPSLPPEQLGRAMWAAHVEAASLCYHAALTKSWRSRPVSGCNTDGDEWVVHGLARLPWQTLARDNRVESTPR